MAPREQKIAKREVPQPGPDFIVVKIHSCALNPVDKTRQLIGTYVDKYPYIARDDGSGVVEEVDKNVSWLGKGGRVSNALDNVDAGGFTDPSNLLFDEGATPPRGLAMAAIGLDQKSERGGADLLAKLSGFDPIIMSASASNEDYCCAAGATHVIDYHSTPSSRPLPIVYDVNSKQEKHKAGREILAPIDHWHVVWMFGKVHNVENVDLGRDMYAELPNLLENGSIKKLVGGEVSGTKLVSRPGETPDTQIPRVFYLPMGLDSLLQNFLRPDQRSLKEGETEQGVDRNGTIRIQSVMVAT
ncbi:hypothetical protein BJV78DRAFT_1157062 [Lactifluus subvellereus]|nr:hypothetical protein BJV78DRAFT_1157062 [Lactifluus subvellereus]